MDDGPVAHDLIGPYALGALDGSERSRFETHLVRCERCRVELPALQGAAAALALDVEVVEVPATLRDRILRAARDERTRDATVLPVQRRRWALPASVGLAAAAAGAAIGLGIWGASLSGDLNRERSARGVDRRAVAVLADPTAVRYPLVGARGQLIVTRAREAALVVANLRRAPRGKTYELWVVTGEQPRAAGLFEGGGGRSLVALRRKVPPGARVAVSLEPTGGSSRPGGTILFGAKTT